jgi:tRNA(Ile)-lysidine synthase
MARGSKTPGARPATPNTFGPNWLATQLKALVPGFPHTPLCVALSGGVDSTALLTALAAIHPRLTALRALHVNHGLRPAARQWAQHCRDLARRLHVPLQVLTTKVTRTPGTSLEAVARDARYELLAAALKPGEALLLAHHADDQLETVLLQLLRGSGLPGLAAMPATAPFAAGTLVRPLLSQSRQQLEAWVRGQGITWVEDDSNADESLNRNYLRRQILPLIHARWPGSAAAVARSARHAAEAQTLLDRLARADLERASYGESLSAKALRALPADRLNNVLRFWITSTGYRVPDTRRLAEISGPLLNAREDANPFVDWGEEGARVQRQGDVLSLSRRGKQGALVPHHGDLLPLSRRDARRGAPASESPSARATAEPATVPPLAAADSPHNLIWSWRDTSTCALPHDLGKLQLEPDGHGPIDLDALPHPLTVRWRRGGERLAPRRGGPRRALKSLLQESQVPVSERPRLPLLFATTPGGEKLLAVADLLLDETVQATSTTRRRARLRWVKSPR